MSLNVRLIDDSKNEIFKSNITHNLTQMANEANIYEAIWRPYRLKKSYTNFNFSNYDEEMKFENRQTILAIELIEPLKEGLHKLKLDSAKYRVFNPKNKWGSYESLVKFVEDYLNACYKNPYAIVEVCR